MPILQDALPNLVKFFSEYGYTAVFMVLILCGLGLPVPEDVSLVAGGVISGLGYTNEHIMFAVGMAGVIVGDGFVFLLGRKYGERILRIRFISGIVTPERYATVQSKFERYGKWVVFMGRFMPGLRMPIFLTAGISRRVSPMIFFSTDFLAAAISVPIWVYLGYHGAKNLGLLMNWVHQGQISVMIFLAFLIIAFYIFVQIKKRIEKKQSEI
ncbi:MAG: DedA family protein [Leptospira sp.]|nr:DedA family protein [Leptospira sp.]